MYPQVANDNPDPDCEDFVAETTAFNTGNAEGVTVPR
jgi:hypothetical protein